MNWDLWIFIVIALGLIVLRVMTDLHVALIIAAAAAVLWWAFDFEVWPWLPWVFWILVIVAILATLARFLHLGLIAAVLAFAIAAGVLVVDFVTTAGEDWAEEADDWRLTNWIQGLFSDEDDEDADEPNPDEVSQGDLEGAASSDHEATEETDEGDGDSGDTWNFWDVMIGKVVLFHVEQALDEAQEAADAATEPAEEDDDSKDEDDESGDAEIEVTAEDIEEQFEEDLVVHPNDLLPNAAQCESDEFINNSIAQGHIGEPGYLQTSDAPTIPFVSSDPDEMLEEIMAENCGNPTILDMNMRALCRLSPNNLNICEYNTWMGEYFDELEEQGLLRTTFLTKKSGESGIFVTDEYTRYAEMTNALLLGFRKLGILDGLMSAENWHVMQRVSGELPITVLNDVQEDMPALVFEWTVKDGCPLVRFGFNTQDKRFELFPTPDCAPPPVESTTTTSTTTTVPCRYNCTTTTVPTTVPTSTTTTTPTTTVPSTTTTEVTTTTTATTTTTLPCPGDKPRRVNGECLPPLNGGTTVAPPATTAAPAVTTTQPTTPPTVTTPATVATPAPAPSTSSAPTVTVEY